MVGLAALKFADLSNHRIQNYVFDLDRFTRFEGKTGPICSTPRSVKPLQGADQATTRRFRTAEGNATSC
jgi:hypothetical protein